MITLEDWALIRHLVPDGVPKSRIATQLRISRITVFSAAESIEPPRYERSSSQTTFSTYELGMRSLLSEYPMMSPTGHRTGGDHGVGFSGLSG